MVLRRDGSCTACIAAGNYFYKNTGDICRETCGDGRNMGLVQCDDGNKVSGDGCDQDCKIEGGWQCRGGSDTTKDICEVEPEQIIRVDVTKYNNLIVEFSGAVSVSKPLSENDLAIEAYD